MNPVLFSVGPLEIRWYSICLLIAFICGVIIIFKEGKRFNIDKDYLFNMLFWTIIFSLLGARIYYVIFNFNEYSNNIMEIFKIWHGGLAIHGGIIAGLLTIIVYTKKVNVSTFKILDMIIPALLLGQAIGRWGNFFNSEAHGAATSLRHLTAMHIPQFIIKGMNINGIYYEPTFLYESLLCLLGFIIILFIRRIKKIRNGQITSIYLVWYGIIRFFIENQRTDSLMIGGFRVAQIISILFIISGVILFIIKSKAAKFEDLYNDEIIDTLNY